MACKRLALIVLLLATAVGPAGCRAADDQATAATPAPSPPASASASAEPDDPAAELAAAAARLAGDTVRVRVAVSGQLSLTGVLDPQTRAAAVKVDMGAVDDGTQAQLRKVGDDMWIKLSGPVPAMLGGTGQWMHLRAGDLSAASSFNVLPGDDPAGVRAMLTAVTGVKRTGPRGFAGTIDLTRSERYSAQTLESLGAKAAFVPFTATTDTQGRLIALSTDLSSIVSGAGQLTTGFSDFGVPVEVERPPAAETTELPTRLKSVIDA